MKETASQVVVRNAECARDSALRKGLTWAVCRLFMEDYFGYLPTFPGVESAE